MALSTCEPRRAAAAAALVLSFVASGASAQQSSSPDADGVKQAAQAKLLEGVGLLKSGRYGTALERFKEAYLIVPSPLIKYDFGLAYLGLGDEPRALEAFEEFLSEAQKAPAEKRQKAVGYRDELRGRVSTVEVRGDLGSVDLLVDGLTVGRVSLPRRLYLRPGSHELVARAGGVNRTATVLCVPGQTAAVELGPSPTVTGLQPQAVAATIVPPPPPTIAATGPTAPASLTLASPNGPAPVVQTGPSRAWAWSAGGVGIVSLGVGLTFGLMARSDGESLTNDATNHRDFMPSTESSGLRNQRLETVFLSVGAVAIAAAVGIYAIARHRETHAAAVGATP